MCISEYEDMEPTDTKLLSIKHDDGYQTLFYLNQTTDKGAMIVAFPVDKEKQHIELIDISDRVDDISHIHSECEKVSNNGVSLKNNDTLSDDGDSYDCEEFIEVHKVGNYKISIANCINDIKNKINWNELGGFTSYAQKGIETCKNKTLFPEKEGREWNYVIAFASTPQPEDGFGVHFYCKDTYIPLCHEEDDIENKNRVSLHDFGTEVSTIGWKVNGNRDLSDITSYFKIEPYIGNITNQNKNIKTIISGKKIYIPDIISTDNSSFIDFNGEYKNFNIINNVKTSV